MFKENRLTFRAGIESAPESQKPKEGISEEKQIVTGMENRLKERIADLMNGKKSPQEKLKTLKDWQTKLKKLYETKRKIKYSNFSEQKEYENILERYRKLTDVYIANEIKKLEEPAKEEVKTRAKEETATLKTECDVLMESKNKYGDLGLTAQEERLLARYKGYRIEKHKPSVQNRTWPHRFEDHEIMLRDLTNPGKNSSMRDLNKMFFPNGPEKSYFIDIGPAVGSILHGSKPATTLQEMADGFPNMECYALDLPDQYEILNGTRSEKEVGYKIDPKNRQEMLKKRNMHFISGNGLNSVKDQIADQKTNPYPEREKTPAIPKNAPVFIRAVNSIDIYCDWENEKDGSPGVKTALLKMAQDFKDNPVMLFFNEQILIKPVGSTQWAIIGHVSPMGFDHMRATHDRKGQRPYTLNPKQIDLAECRQMKQPTRTVQTLDSKISYN